MDICAQLFSDNYNNLDTFVFDRMKEWENNRVLSCPSLDLFLCNYRHNPTKIYNYYTTSQLKNVFKEWIKSDIVGPMFKCSLAGLWGTLKNKNYISFERFGDFKAWYGAAHLNLV